MHLLKSLICAANAMDMPENLDRRSFIKAGALGAAAAVTGLARARHSSAAQCGVERVSAADTDITFAVASDLHYDSRASNKAIQAHIDRLNSLPGTPYPAFVGGSVKPFEAVILNGDLTNRGLEAEWKLFADDWGLLGEKRCMFPIYEGFGNHDLRGDDVVRIHVKERNKLRKGLANISVNGFHYSWDMGDVHFIQANLVAADKGELNPLEALSFVKSDLKKFVGDSGRPVILNYHYAPLQPLGTFQEFRPSERKALVDVLSKYNVIGIFCGHSHGYMHADGKRVPNPHYECEKFPGSNIDQYDSGSMRDDGARPKWKDSGRFFVVHVTNTTMTVVMNTPRGWGVPHTKAICFPDDAQPSGSKTSLSRRESVFYLRRLAFRGL